MKDLPHHKGRRLISELVAEGEHQHQDFKFAISDARKIARSISAFANAGGGRLLIGVKDNGTIAGVRNEEDVYVVEQAAQRYCRPAVEVEFTAYTVDSNIVVIKASIPQAARRPVKCQEPDGSWRAYYRVDDENIVAHPLMVRAWQTTSSVKFELTDEVSRMLECLDRDEKGFDVAELAQQIGISEHRCRTIIVSLAASGVIGFTYHAPRFRITRQK